MKQCQRPSNRRSGRSLRKRSRCYSRRRTRTIDLIQSAQTGFETTKPRIRSLPMGFQKLIGEHAPKRGHTLSNQEWEIRDMTSNCPLFHPARPVRRERNESRTTPRYLPELKRRSDSCLLPASQRATRADTPGLRLPNSARRRVHVRR